MPASAAGLIQLAWRFLLFQKDSALALWFRARTESAAGVRKTKMIVALASKLLSRSGAWSPPAKSRLASCCGKQL